MTTSTQPAPPFLVVSAATKTYGGVQALAGVDFAIRPGQVHAIVGENGAGKSTLMKILAGAEQPDSGTVAIDGEEVSLASTADARAHGVAIVFQELNLFPQLDVLANLFLLREPRRGGLLSRREMARQAGPVLDAVGLDVDLRRPVEHLALGERQLLEIAHALLDKSRLLILDEPNSALNAQETERLFAIIRRLRAGGTAVLYVSHRLEEVFAISDHITVLKDGSIVSSRPAAETSMRRVLTEMIGHEPPRRHPVVPPEQGAPRRLEVRDVSVGEALQNVNLEALEGEVVGLAGLEGAGVRVLLDVLFGVRAAEAGSVALPDGTPGARSVAGAVRSGIAHVPADRRRAGVMLDQSVAANLVHVSAGALGRDGFFMRRGSVADRVNRRISELRIKTPTPMTPVGQLSGGNQQKVVLGKWLEADPKVVLLDDPTRGVDVGAKDEIYRVIRGLAEERRVVLFTSSELLEYTYLCHRVYVFYQGRIRTVLSGDEVTEEHLLHAVNTGAAA